MTAPASPVSGFGSPLEDDAPPDAVGGGSPAKPAPQKRGPLLDLPEDEAAKEALRAWEKDDWFHKKLAGEAAQNAAWRSGERFVRLVADKDNDTVRITTPIGADALPPAPNKLEEAIQNAMALLMADPPRPDCEPAGDRPEDRDAAQFATRFLQTLATESALNLDAVLAQALDVSSTYYSAFAHICADPTAGGLAPLSIKARPSATREETALTGDDPEGTGAMDTAPFVTKYVRADGSLSDTPEGARMTWDAGLACEVLNANQVRFLPRLSTGIETALGAVVCRPVPFGALRAKYPAIDRLSLEQQHALVAWRPKDYKRLIPGDWKLDGTHGSATGNKAERPVDDDALCFPLTVYFKAHPTYPKGCYAVFVGGKHRVYAEDWIDTAEDGRVEPLDLPLAQMRWEIDTQTRSPYGKHPIRRIGPMDEMIAQNTAALAEYLYKFSRPRVFLPMGSIVQPEDWDDHTRPVSFNPQGKPEFMPLPPYPQEGFKLIEWLSAQIDNTMGVQGPAMGQVAGSVRSAEQLNTQIEQSNVALTLYRDNAKDFWERLCRLILQVAKKTYTAPQLMRYRGEGGAYQVEEFTRATFGSTVNVRCQKGSFSMLAPTAKNELLRMEVENGGLTIEEAARLRRDNVSGLVGIQDSPHVLRIRRQLQAWRRGPTPEAMRQAEMQAQQMAQEQAMQAEQMAMQPVDPMAPPMAPPPPPDPANIAGMAVLSRQPVDDEQLVAQQRHQELARAVAEIDFYGHPPGWKQALIDTYLHARMASGIQTIPEQQQAAQQQAEQQAQQAQQQQQGQAQEKKEAQGAQQAHQSQEKARDREAQQQMARERDAMALEREATKAAMQAASARGPA